VGVVSGAVILVDVSGSMSYPVAPQQRRIDVLRIILARVREEASTTRVVAFSTDVVVLEPGETVPEPDGGTALHLALDYVRQTQPEHVIVISDGEPEDKQAAITVARALGCRISTYYCGDEGNRAATSFLKTLALCSRRGVGRAAIADLRQPEKVASDVRLLLAGPAR
jgi:hypothetical protein